MGTTCIITKHRNEASETFIRAHIDLLSGTKVVLYGDYPDYICNDRQIRYFHGSHPIRKKLAKALPYYFYERLILPKAFSENSVHDYISGFLKDHNVDVILAEYGFYGAEICPHARELGIPLVVHFHGQDAHREPELPPFRKRYQRMFEYAYGLISVSNLMTAKLIKLGADPARIVYNPCGPQNHFYDIKPEYSDTFVAVGRFTDIKAPYLTILAFKQLTDDYPQASLVMVGDGPLRETCIGLAKALGIEHKTSFPGALGHDHTKPLLGKACCFLQHSVTPSYGDAEGTPVAILEAGAAALPVVSTRHAGIADVVVHGETGFLVDERDVTGMKGYMLSLVRNKELCRKMGENARGHIRANYGIDRHIACIDKQIDGARNQKQRT